ncbi:MAG: DUF5107 domain-containing protein [Armatimonadetes bacterium]|nr:DUF5107 domain-containing protein [Armatimonadota bacterium]
MTELRVEPYVMPAADLGPENPLPTFRDPQPDRAVDFEAHHIPEEDREGLGWQTGFRVLPYRIQDGYNRRREPREFTCIVLENDYLRVRVLPEVGGKVISIFAKPEQRDLLLCNPVFQPGNLALRNAWTSGGIEWNIGQVGHHYLTCSPLHAAEVEGPGGEPVLRLYAWERVKRVPYHLDLYLPTESRFLLTRVRIINPHDHDIPMYWWTNMGVPEYPEGRVIAPADTTYHGLTVYECPVINGIDYSYCTHIKRSYDLFFRIPPGRRPWEVSVDQQGRGIVHTSTRRLRGRKLFAWGMSQGGRRWQEYLHTAGYNNKEIQAGLAYTQSHSVRMPAGEVWSWTEAIGYFAMDPDDAHSPDWQRAHTAADAVVEAALPEEELNRLDAVMGTVSTRLPTRLLFRGLGWGALENARCAQCNEPSGIPPELPFDQDDLSADQQPWLELLQTGALPPRAAHEEPGQFMVQPEWRALLEASVAAGRSDHWLAWLHLGVMRLEDGDAAGARQAWEESLDRTPTAWAWRNLAVLNRREGNEKAALECYERALAVGVPPVALAVEYAGHLLRNGAMDRLASLLNELPATIRDHERLRLAAGWVALHEKRFGDVRTILGQEFATIQEGERSLTDLWFALHEQELAAAEGVVVDETLKERVRAEFPPPWDIDFRMSVEGDDLYVPPQAG